MHRLRRRTKAQNLIGKPATKLVFSLSDAKTHQAAKSGGEAGHEMDLQF